MPFKRIKMDYQTGISEYVLDSVDDLKALPISLPMGSTAFIIATAVLYIKNSNGEWIKKNDTMSFDGVQMLVGKDGKSAYDIAVEQGFSGTESEWLTSLVGRPGNTPTIGDNGNWYIDNIDTGVAAEINLEEYLKREEITDLIKNEINKVLYSGKTSNIIDLDGFNAMLDNDQEEITISLNKDLSTPSTLIIPEGKTVVLDLNGSTLSGPMPLAVVGGTLDIKNGTVSSVGGSIIARAGGTVIVDDATITSTGSNAISATDSEVIINNGLITSQEAGIAGFKNSQITINGGTLVGLDNCPVMGNGSSAGSANDGTNMNVVMNNGRLEAHIQSNGYIACGVYVPNSGSFTMNGGEIVSDGAGIVMRGGTVNLNGGKIIASGTSGVKGKVGDSRVTVGPYAVVYDESAKYPAADTLELNIGEDIILTGTDGALDVLLSEGAIANINDATGDYYN